MRAGYFLLGPAAFLCLWGALTYTGAVKPILLPTPGSVLAKLGDLFGSGEILPDIGQTLYRWLAGFAVGVAVGIPAGLLMGYDDRTRKSLEFLVDCLRSIPVISLFPLFLIFFGIGNVSKVAVAAWTTALAVLVNSMYGASRAKELWLLTARSLGATPGQTFWKVVVPGALPEVFVGLRIAISHALVLVVASEMMLGGTHGGLGRRLSDAAMIYRTAEVYAVICVTGVLGFVSNAGFLAVERRAVPWAKK